MTNVADWPLGLEKDAALLNLTPAEISQRVGARFKAGEDGLDAYDAAVLRVRSELWKRSDLVFALQQYRHYPVPGVKLVIHPRDAAQIGRIARALRLSPDDLQWVAPDLEDGFDAAVAGRLYRRSGLRGATRTGILKERLRRRA